MPVQVLGASQTGSAAFAMTVEDSGKSTETGTGAWTEDTASVTFAEGEVVIVAASYANQSGTATPTGPTVTGSGLSFTAQSDSQKYASRRWATVATATVGAGGFSGVLTVSGDGQSTGTNQEAMWIVLKAEGLDATTNDGIVQDQWAVDAGDVTPTTVTLGATPDTANATVTFMFGETDEDYTISGFTNLTAAGSTGGANTRRIEVAYDDTTPGDSATWAWTTTMGTGIWVAEMNVAAAGEPHLEVPDGAVDDLSIAFVDDPDTGIYNVATNELGIVGGGSLLLSVPTGPTRFHDHLVIFSGTQIRSAVDTVGAPGFAWDGEQDCGLYNPAANVVGMVTNGAERMRVTASAVEIATGHKLTGTITDPTTDADVGDRGYNDARNLDAAINNETASYILALTDRGQVVEMNVGSANNLTVPPNTDVAFPIGTHITVMQMGAGTTTFVQGSGVTIRKNANWSLALRGQYASATLIKRATDEWYLSGDLAKA